MSTWRITNNGDLSGTFTADRIDITGNRLTVYQGEEIVLSIYLHKHARLERIKKKEGK